MSPSSANGVSHALDGLLGGRRAHRGRDRDDDHDRDEREAIAAEGAPTSVPTAADILRARAARGPVRRLATRLPALDTALAGGLPYGSLVTLVGAPSAGKTAVALHVAAVASETMRVVYIAVDDPAVPERLALRAGHDVDADDYDVGAAAAAVPMIYVVDGSSTTVDDAIAALGDEPGLVVVDSVQTARSAESDRTRDPRARVDAIVAPLRRARGAGHIVLALSEASRAYYRSRRRDEQIDPLAAGKESSSIEYASDIVLALRSERGSRSASAEIAKARIRGARRGAVIRLTVDDRTCVTSDDVDDAAEESDEERDRISAVVDVVREQPGIVTRELRMAVQRRAHCRADVAGEAIATAVAMGAVVATVRGRATHHRVAPESIMSWAASRGPTTRRRRSR